MTGGEIDAAGNISNIKDSQRNRELQKTYFRHYEWKDIRNTYTF